MAHKVLAIPAQAVQRLPEERAPRFRNLDFKLTQ